MTDRELVEKVARWITSSTILGYAKATGWTRTRTYADRILFEFPSPGISRQLIVPLFGDDDDWPAALYEIVIRLAEQEKESVAEVLRDLLGEHIADPWSKNIRRSFNAMRKLCEAERELNDVESIR